MTVSSTLLDTDAKFVVWWELGISTRPPFSTLRERAFGLRPPALQYVDIFYFIRPHILRIHTKPVVSLGGVACGRRAGAEVEH